MAGDSYIGTSHAAAQKFWRVGVTHEAEANTTIMALASEDKRAGVFLCNELSKGPGDTIKLKFSETSTNYSHPGLNDKSTLVGEGLDLEYLPFEFVIDYQAQTWKLGSVMSQQRISADMKEDSFEKAWAYWADRFDVSGLNQLCGCTHAIVAGGGEDQYNFVGMNPVTAVDAAHVIYSVESGAYTTDETIAADPEAVFSLRLVDEAVKRAMSASYSHSWRVPPTENGKYIVPLHPEQGGQLRDSSSDLEWGNLQKSEIQGGASYEQSGFNTWVLGEYGRTQFIIDDRVPLGQNSSTSTASVAKCRRAPFIGAKALACGFGQGYAADSHLDWTEAIVDIKKWQVVVDSIFGMKRVMFSGTNTNETFGNFVLSTYSEV